MEKMSPNSDPGTVFTHLRLQRLRELLAAPIENRGLLDETLLEIFNSLDEIEKENEELLRMNEALTSSGRILRKDPQLLREALDPSPIPTWRLTWKALHPKPTILSRSS